MPLSSGFEYVVLRYGKSYMKYVSQMFLNYLENMMNVYTCLLVMCRSMCLYVFVIFIYIYTNLYIYMPPVTQHYYPI